MPGFSIGFLWGLSLLIIWGDRIALKKNSSHSYIWPTIIQIISFTLFALPSVFLYVSKYSTIDMIGFVSSIIVLLIVFGILNNISHLLRLITPNTLAFLITLVIGIFSIEAHGFDNKLIGVFISSVFSSYKDQLLGTYKEWYDHKFNNTDNKNGSLPNPVDEG